ncbi:hypothetical protein [Daejeonella sp.]|uniref:hypothetical protein n=1 Tax=Daejeonella sp. TaxID=2805397 RepID=UPI0030C290B3
MNQDYSFLTADIEVNTLRQGNDILYKLKCYTNQPCQARPAKRYRIIESIKTGDFTILKLEQLDTLQLTTDPFPLTRYAVHVIKISDNKQLGYLTLRSGLTRQELDAYQTDFSALREMFFFTYFSVTYLKELSTLKTVTTKAEAQSILDYFKSGNFNSLIETYKKAGVPDMYGSGLVGELVSRSCIAKGYNPLGAGPAIEELLKQ